MKSWTRMVFSLKDTGLLFRGSSRQSVSLSKGWKSAKSYNKGALAPYTRAKQGRAPMIQEELFALQDTEYAAFQSKLTPNIPRESTLAYAFLNSESLLKGLEKAKKLKSFFSPSRMPTMTKICCIACLFPRLKTLTTVSQRLMHFFPMSITGPCVTSCRRGFSKRTACVF